MMGKIIGRGNMAGLGQNRNFFSAIIIPSKVLPDIPTTTCFWNIDIKFYVNFIII